jgi:hypothetical protein
MSDSCKCGWCFWCEDRKIKSLRNVQPDNEEKKDGGKRESEPDGEPD